MDMARARDKLVVCVHQDVYPPAEWGRLILFQYRMTKRRFGPIGVAGVYGIGPVAEGLGRESSVGARPNCNSH
jgi:hypothetical protein